MSLVRRYVLPVVVLLAGAAGAPYGRPEAQTASTVPPSLYAGLSWRQIGPFRGGRVAAVTGVPSEPETYYLGAALGGVWKTTDGGHAWTPIFDHASPLGSIGAIAVSRLRSERHLRRHGRIGAPRRRLVRRRRLEVDRCGQDLDARRLDRQPAHRAHRDRSARSERGAGGRAGARLRTERTSAACSARPMAAPPGGRSSTGDAESGAIDLAADPDNPSTVFAALWQCSASRGSWTSGGQGSGLYKSTDEGLTWTPVTGHGLPETVLGKIGISVAAGTGGRRVYALVEADHGGLFRSDDGGATWTLASDEHLLYIARLVLHEGLRAPDQPRHRVRRGQLAVEVDRRRQSLQQGDRARRDNHDLWINPRNPARMIEGNDQGVRAHGQRRHNLGQAQQPANRAVLPRVHRSAVPVHPLRRRSRTWARSGLRAAAGAASTTRTGSTWAATTPSAAGCGRSRTTTTSSSRAGTTVRSRSSTGAATRSATSRRGRTPAAGTRYPTRSTASPGRRPSSSRPPIRIFSIWVRSI